MSTSNFDTILPYDGELILVDDFLSKNEADAYFMSLSNEVNWMNDEVMMFGKKLILSRKMALFGDSDLSYKYSKVEHKAQFWNLDLLTLKKQIEEKTQCVFNTCLLNYYHHGNEGMGWHSDDEKELGINPIIASVSLGAERKFMYKHKVSNEKVELYLKHGSLLLMKGTTQHHWLHSLPKSKKISEPRINLTFRKIMG